MSDLNVYTTSQITALTPITGDMVLDSDLNAVKLYDGAAWKTYNGTVASTYQNRWGASFDGVDDYLAVSEINIASGGLTFSAWVNFSDITGTQRPIIAEDGNLSNWFFRPSNNYFYIRDLANNQTYAGPWSGTPATDTWYHMMLIDDGLGNNNSSVKAYIDGALVGSFVGATGVDGFKIDSIARCGARYFPGKIDEVAVWGSDQTSNIATIYNSGVPSDLTSLNPTGYWRMGDDSNDTASAGGSIATITDSSGNGYDATQSTASNQPTFSDLTGESIYA